ncbi:hypothetical protein CLOM_g12488, partial [Closterium sp. NIES-68]
MRTSRDGMAAVALLSVLTSWGVLVAPFVAQVQGQTIDSSQLQALWDMQTSWGRTFDQWDTGGDCNAADGISCNSQGMVTWLELNQLNLGGPLPDTIGDLVDLSH